MRGFEIYIDFTEPFSTIVHNFLLNRVTKGETEQLGIVSDKILSRRQREETNLLLTHPYYNNNSRHCSGRRIVINVPGFQGIGAAIRIIITRKEKPSRFIRA